MNNAPIIIIACHRSGTTLLRLMLTSHSQISIPNEFPLIEIVLTQFSEPNLSEKDIEKLLKIVSKDDRFEDWKISSGQLKTDLFNQLPAIPKQTVIETFYKNYLNQSNENKTIWGDKTIGTLSHIKNIVSLFPTARFIHLVRDGRDVACSLQTHFRKPPVTGFPGRNRKLVTDTVGGALLWKEGEMMIENQKKSIPIKHYYQILYSDLVNQPEIALRNLCQFLQIPFEKENLLSFYEKNKSEKLISEKRLSIHQNTLKPVTKDREHVYLAQLSKLEIKTIDFLLKSLLKKYGMTMDLPKFWEMPLVFLRITKYYLSYFFEMTAIYGNYYFNRIFTKFNIG